MILNERDVEKLVRRLSKRKKYHVLVLGYGCPWKKTDELWSNLDEMNINVRVFRREATIELEGVLKENDDLPVIYRIRFMDISTMTLETVRGLHIHKLICTDRVSAGDAEKLNYLQTAVRRYQ
jgi:hypothetical protein